MPVPTPFLKQERHYEKVQNHHLGIIASVAGGQPGARQRTNLDAANSPRQQALGGVQEHRIAYANPATATPTRQAAPQAQIQMPRPETLIIMIRSSLVALSQANITNNYSVLNQLGSGNFRKANPPTRLAQLFNSFRTNKIDLAPVVFVTPQLSKQPEIVNGKLHLVGNFPTQPMRVDFNLQFEPSDGIWKLFGLSVDLNRVQPRQAAQQRFVPGQGAQPASR